jgi:hypothetical protein
MKTKTNLIVLLFLSIPFLFGYTLKSNHSIVKQTSAMDTIQIPQKGTVYMYRTGRAVGMVIKIQVKVNGRDAGGIGNNNYFEWDLEPGVYTFSAFTKESSPIVEMDVKPGEKYYLRIDQRVGLTQGGRVTLKQVEDSKAISEMRKTKKLVSSYRE